MTEDETPIWGAEAIGAAINRTERQTHYLLSTGAIPAKKIGGRWVTTRRQLKDIFNPRAAR